MSIRRAQFNNLPPLVTRLIRSKLNNRSLAMLAMASKNENTRANLQVARERKRVNELRRITRAAAWAVLDANRMRTDVVSSALWVEQVADELGFRYDSSEYAGLGFGFDGEFYQTAHEEFEGGWDVVLLDKSRLGNEEIAWFGMRDHRVMFSPDMSVSESDPALQIIQRTLDAINHKLDGTHRNHAERSRTERNRTETSSNRSKSARNWRAPRVPATGPANFVSNMTQMFPNSPHVRTLRRALINNTSRTANQRLALAAKAVMKLLNSVTTKSRQGVAYQPLNAKNIAKTTDLLKAWRSYQNWHTKRGNSVHTISKKRKR